MKSNTQMEGRQILKATLQAFCAAQPKLGQREQALLARLEAAGPAQDAFALVPEPGRAAALLSTILQAAELQADFGLHIARAKRDLGSRTRRGELERCEKALSALRTYLSELQTGSVGWIQAQTIESPESLVRISAGLTALEDLVGAQRRIAQETLKRLGATRKANGRQAATLAALGWLADGVKRLTDRPHRNHVAALARVVLRVRVSEDQIRAAERTRKREWRMPLTNGPVVNMKGPVSRTRNVEESLRSAAHAKQPRLTTLPRA